MSQKNVLAVLLLCLFMTGCASAKQYFALPDQSQFVEDETKARIYVVRPSMMASAIGFSVTDNDVAIGRTGGNSYLCWEREPGTVKLKSKAENESSVQFIAEANKRYYIKQSPRIGIMMARVHIEEIESQEGEKWVKKCKLPKVVGNQEK